MLHGQVGRMGAFYDLSPLLAFKASPPLPPYLCATLMHFHTDTHRRSLRETQEFVKSCTVFSFIHTVQKPSASWCRGSFSLGFKTKGNMKNWNQRQINWYRNSETREFLIWIVFLKNSTAFSRFYSSVSIHLFEKWRACWKAGKTPGRECKYPETGDLNQQARGKIHFST